MLTFMMIMNFFGMFLNIMLIQANSPTMMLPPLILMFSLLALMIWNLNTFWNWMAYTVFLIFVGGLLILLSYIITLTPNTKIYYKSSLISMILIIMIPVMLIMYLLDLPMMNMHSMQPQSMFSSQMNSNLLYIFSASSTAHTSMLMLLLFFVMVAVTILLKTSYGTLRSN